MYVFYLHLLAADTKMLIPLPAAPAGVAPNHHAAGVGEGLGGDVGIP